MGKIHQWLVGVREKSRMRVGFPLGWQAHGDPCQPNRRRKSTNTGGQENVASQKTNGPWHRKPRIGWLGLHGWERGATILSRSLTLKRNNRAVTRQECRVEGVLSQPRERNQWGLSGCKCRCWGGGWRSTVMKWDHSRGGMELEKGHLGPPGCGGRGSETHMHRFFWRLLVGRGSSCFWNFTPSVH